jgi:hypothetical protein
MVFRIMIPGYEIGSWLFYGGIYCLHLRDKQSSPPLYLKSQLLLTFWGILGGSERAVAPLASAWSATPAGDISPEHYQPQESETTQF